MTTRIYAVEDNVRELTHLVEASSQGQAIATVSRQQYAARIPSQKEVVELMQAGTKVVKAGSETA